MTSSHLEKRSGSPLGSRLRSTGQEGAGAGEPEDEKNVCGGRVAFGAAERLSAWGHPDRRGHLGAANTARDGSVRGFCLEQSAPASHCAQSAQQVADGRRGPTDRQERSHFLPRGNGSRGRALRAWGSRASGSSPELPPDVKPGCPSTGTQFTFRGARAVPSFSLSCCPV